MPGQSTAVSQCIVHVFPGVGGLAQEITIVGPNYVVRAPRNYQGLRFVCFDVNGLCYTRWVRYDANIVE